MHFDLSGVVSLFQKVAAVIFFAGLASVAVWAFLGHLPKRRRVATAELTFTLLAFIGALIVLL